MRKTLVSQISFVYSSAFRNLFTRWIRGCMQEHKIYSLYVKFFFFFFRIYDSEIQRNCCWQVKACYLNIKCLCAILQAFNLRRTTTSKPSITSETAPNASVSAILEKANAIRQVSFVFIICYLFFFLFSYDLRSLHYL